MEEEETHSNPDLPIENINEESLKENKESLEENKESLEENKESKERNKESVKKSEIVGGVDPEQLKARLLEIGGEVKEDAEPEEEPEEEVEKLVELEGKEEDVEEEEICDASIINIGTLFPEGSEDLEYDDYLDVNFGWKPTIYGNIKIFLPDKGIIRTSTTEGRKPVEVEDIINELYRKEATAGYVPPDDLRIELESKWWKYKFGCGKCPSKYNCTCGMALMDIVRNLCEYFDLLVIPDNRCTTCLQILNEIRHREISFCQLNLEDIDDGKKEELKNQLEKTENYILLSHLIHHWSHENKEFKSFRLQKEEIPLKTSDFYDIIIIGNGSATIGACREAEKYQLNVCVLNVLEKNSCSMAGFNQTQSIWISIHEKLLMEAVEVHKRLKAGRDYGMSGVDDAFFDWQVFKTLARHYLKWYSWQRKSAMLRTGAIHLEGTPSVIDRNTVRIVTAMGDTLELHTKYIIISLDQKMSYEPFPGLYSYCIRMSGLFCAEMLGVSKVLVFGEAAKALESAVTFLSLGMVVTVMIDLDFHSKYDDDMVSILLNNMQNLGVKVIRNMKIYGVAPVPFDPSGLATIPGVSERLMVVGKCMKTGKFSKLFVDNVVVLPVAMPLCPIQGLTDVGVKVSHYEPNFIEVDGNMRSSVSNIYAIGSTVSGTLDSDKSFQYVGAKCVQHLLGQIDSVPRFLLGLGTLNSLPVYAFYGPTERRARSMYSDVVVYHALYDEGNDLLLRTDPKTPVYTKLICRQRPSKEEPVEDIIGLHMLGNLNVSEVVRGFSYALSQGLTKGELDKLIGLDYTIAQSVIGIYTIKKEGDPPLTIG